MSKADTQKTAPNTYATVRDWLEGAVEKANQNQADTSIGSLFATINAPDAPSALLRIEKRHLIHHAGDDLRNFKQSLLSTTALTPPSMLYLPRHVGETLMQADVKNIYLVEKQPGQSLLQRIMHHNQTSGQPLLNENGSLVDQHSKLAMLQELLALRADENRKHPFIKGRPNPRPLHSNPLTELMVDMLLIESCHTNQKSDDHALFDFSSSNALLDAGVVEPDLPQDFDEIDDPESPYNQSLKHARPASNARWVDYIRDTHSKFSSHPNQDRFDAFCKNEWLKNEMKKHLYVNTANFTDQEKVHATAVNGAMSALISEAWYEAKDIARAYIASGKPVFAKLEGVEAVALTDPPEKLFAALQEIERQRDAARAEHSITSQR